MDNTEKSLQALEAILKNIDKEELRQIVERIDSIAFEGPTIKEYLENFESYYQTLYSVDTYDRIDNKPIFFNKTTLRNSVKLIRPPIIEANYKIPKQNGLECSSGHFFS
jgi:hypothetical protein